MKKYSNTMKKRWSVLMLLKKIDYRGLLGTGLVVSPLSYSTVHILRTRRTHTVSCTGSSFPIL